MADLTKGNNLLNELTYLGLYKTLSNILPYTSERIPAQYKKMRMYPMCWLGLNFIKLGLAYVPIVVESDDIDAKLITEAMLKKIWWKTLNESLENLDFGFKSAEIRWERGIVTYYKRGDEISSDTKVQGIKKICDMPDGREKWEFEGLILKSPKGLDPETVRILTEPETGNLLGFEQYGVPQKILCKDKKAILYTHMLESGQYYGISGLEPAYAYWFDANLNRQFHMRWLERKGVGIFKGMYPTGVTEDGKDNQDVMLELLSGIVEGRVVSIPSTRDVNGNLLWEIGFLKDEDATDPFINRAKYLDETILKALIIPEKALTQGEVGARASIEAYQDIFMQRKEQLLDANVDTVNEYLVKPFVDLNFGNGIDVQVSSGEFSDDSKVLAGKLVETLIGNGSLKVQTQWLIDKTSIPLEELEEDIVEDKTLNPQYDAQGNLIDENGNSVDEQGNLIDKNGDPIKDDSIDMEGMDEENMSMSETGRWRALNELENKYSLSDIDSFLTEKSAQFQRDIKDEIHQQQDRIITYIKKNYTADAKFVSTVNDIEVRRNSIKRIFKSFLNDVYSYVFNQVQTGVEGTLVMSSADTSNQFIGFRVDMTAEKFASDYENTLKYQVSSDLASRLSENEILDKLKQMTEDFLSDAKLSNIAETEIGFTLGKSFEDYLKTNALSIAKGILDAGKEVQRVKFSAIMDTQTCPICKKLDGTVTSMDSSIRSKYDPPLHYMCRCVWLPITLDDINDTGISGTDMTLGSKGKPATLDDIISMIGLDSKYKLFSETIKNGKLPVLSFDNKGKLNKFSILH